MSPPDPPEVGKPLPEPPPEDDRGQGIADCYRALEDEREETHLGPLSTHCDRDRPEPVRDEQSQPSCGTACAGRGFSGRTHWRRMEMRSVLLWIIGIPIPLILLLAFCTHHL
jgi:hypothetical protein